MAWKFFKSDGSFIGKEEVDDPRPPGIIMMHGSTTAPTGFLVCDGSLYDSATYTNLYNAIGSNFNTGGEPVGYFRVPNFTSGVFPIGSSALNTVGSSGGSVTHSHSGASHTHSDPDGHSHTFASHQHGVSHSHTTSNHRHGSGSYSLAAEADNGPGTADAYVSGTVIALSNQTVGSRHAHGVNGVTGYENPSLSFSGSATSGASGGGSVSSESPSLQSQVLNVDNNQANPKNHLPPNLPIYFIIKT